MDGSSRTLKKTSFQFFCTRLYVSKKIDKFNVINYFWFERWLFEKKEIFYLWKLSASLLLFCTEISLFECTRSLLWRIKLNWFECWANVCNAVLGNRLEFIAKVPRFDFKPCDDCYFCEALCQLISVVSALISSKVLSDVTVHKNGYTNIFLIFMNSTERIF